MQIAVPAAPAPDSDDAHRGQLLLDHAQGVGQRREHDDRGAVLVVVEDRDVQALAQPLLDLEAARGRDVLEVDAPEPGRDHLDRLDDLVGVLAGQADRPGVDVGEPLEQRGLALHHRQRRPGSDVAEPQHRRAVGDHGDAVALDRQPAYVVGVVVERHADPADARRVGHRQVVAVAQRHLGGDLDLAADVQQEGPVADLVDLDAVDRVGRLLELVGVVGVAGRAGDVEDQPLPGRVDDVDRGDHATRRGDGRRDGADDAVVGCGVQPHGDRVRRRGGAHPVTLVPRRRGQVQLRPAWPRGGRAGSWRTGRPSCRSPSTSWPAPPGRRPWAAAGRW